MSRATECRSANLLCWKASFAPVVRKPRRCPRGDLRSPAGRGHRTGQLRRTVLARYELGPQPQSCARRSSLFAGDGLCWTVMRSGSLCCGMARPCPGGCWRRYHVSNPLGGRPMSVPQPRHPGYTLEDWQTWEGNWELIHGVAYPTYGMTPSPSLEHQRVSIHLASDILLALKEVKRRNGGGECEVFTAPVDVFLEAGVVQPDLVVVCDPAKKSDRGIEGAPDLVVEILSPSTA